MGFFSLRRIGSGYILQVFLQLLSQCWVSLKVRPHLREQVSARERRNHFDKVLRIGKLVQIGSPGIELADK